MTQAPAPIDEVRVWPERQITVMGRVDADTPRQLVADERGLVAPDAFAAYERQMAERAAGAETSGISPVPGPLLEAPRQPTPGGFADSQSPAEAMRRFDEIAELRRLIGRIQSVVPADRTTSDQEQLRALWYRLGMISREVVLLDSAIEVVDGYLRLLDDPHLRAEWGDKRDRLTTRRAAMNR